MFPNTFLLTLMMISFTRRKNVQPVKFQSEYIQNPVVGSLASSYVVSWQCLSHSDQLDPSTAASATVVWRGLIIIVRGWFVQQPKALWWISLNPTCWYCDWYQASSCRITVLAKRIPNTSWPFFYGKLSSNWILLGNSLYVNGSLVFCRHFILCLYGAVAIGFILAGRVKELGIVHILTSK